MENRRFILIAVFGAILFFIYQAWQTDYGQQVASRESETAALTQAAVTDADIPKATTDTGTQTKSVADATVTTSGSDARIRVETDLYVAEIATRGGELRHIDLKGYRVAKDRPEALALLDDRAGRLFVLQSGLAGTEAPLATNETPYTSSQSQYQLAPGEKQLDVVLESVGSDGLKVRK